MEPVQSAKGVLTRKIGPLPAIAWGGIFGGLYVGYRYWKQANSDSGGTATAADGATPVVQAVGSVGTADDFSDGYGNATGGFGTIPGSTTQNTYQEPANQTNLDWGKQAVNWLIATGVLPSDAQNAISAYLYGGMTVNETQLAAINEALRKLGSPPEGPLPIPEIAKAPSATPIPTTPTPTPAPTAWTKPSWLTSRFVISENGGAVYQVTEKGLEWVPSESAFYALGGGGTVNLKNGPFTYTGNPKGTAPVAITDAVLASLPKVGATP